VLRGAGIGDRGAFGDTTSIVVGSTERAGGRGIRGFACYPEQSRNMVAPSSKLLTTPDCLLSIATACAVGICLVHRIERSGTEDKS
jgi:hypothetical protein